MCVCVCTACAKSAGIIRCYDSKMIQHFRVCFIRSYEGFVSVCVYERRVFGVHLCVKDCISADA